MLDASTALRMKPKASSKQARNDVVKERLFRLGDALGEVQDKIALCTRFGRSRISEISLSGMEVQPRITRKCCGELPAEMA
jgi:hypothetical protein